jgi:hypothetical protein
METNRWSIFRNLNVLNPHSYGVWGRGVQYIAALIFWTWVHYIAAIMLWTPGSIYYRGVQYFAAIFWTRVQNIVGFKILYDTGTSEFLVRCSTNWAIWSPAIEPRCRYKSLYVTTVKLSPGANFDKPPSPKVRDDFLLNHHLSYLSSVKIGISGYELVYILCFSGIQYVAADG